jgi:hypothetical protein
MPDQTTDHLSGAVEAFRKEVHRGPGSLLLNATMVRGGLRAAESHFATYYEDKGRREAERRAIEAEEGVAKNCAVAVREAKRAYAAEQRLAQAVDLLENQQATRPEIIRHLAALADSDPPDALDDECDSCDDTGIYEEGSEWAPCLDCDLGRRWAEILKVCAAEYEDKGRSEERERLRALADIEDELYDDARPGSSAEKRHAHRRNAYLDAITALASLDSDQEADNG